MYLTLEELQTITAIVEFHLANFTSGVGMETKLYDINGEYIGMVTVTEGGTPGFIPSLIEPPDLEARSE